MVSLGSVLRRWIFQWLETFRQLLLAGGKFPANTCSTTDDCRFEGALRAGSSESLCESREIEIPMLVKTTIFELRVIALLCERYELGVLVAVLKSVCLESERLPGSVILLDIVI